ncbi:MAG TPA: hypothetical protein VMQ17_08165 [Candidatus Sulfotelmatobacter sp.]|nr:hypothetical protein [Candidatus Sulfotelmatobacter sp.]
MAEKDAMLFQSKGHMHQVPGALGFEENALQSKHTKGTSLNRIAPLQRALPSTILLHAIREPVLEILAS